MHTNSCAHTGRERKRALPSASPLPSWLQWPQLGQTIARGQQLHLSLPHGYKGLFIMHMNTKITILGSNFNNAICIDVTSKKFTLIQYNSKYIGKVRGVHIFLNDLANLWPRWDIKSRLLFNFHFVYAIALTFHVILYPGI